MKRYLLDTNTVSYFIRKQSADLNLRVRAAMERGDAAISAITRAELRYGVALRTEEATRLRLLVESFLVQVPTLNWTSAAADHFGRLAAMQKRSGQPIGTMDTQIAAHALAENLVLVTHNTRYYQQIPGLVLENWTE